MGMCAAIMPTLAVQAMRDMPVDQLAQLFALTDCPLPALLLTVPRRLCRVVVDGRCRAPSLDLSGTCRATNGPAAAFALELGQANLAKGLKHVTKLSLARNRLGAAAAANLMPLLQHVSALRSLSLAGCALGCEGLERLALSLSPLAALEVCVVRQMWAATCVAGPRVCLTVWSRRLHSMAFAIRDFACLHNLTTRTSPCIPQQGLSTSVVRLQELDLAENRVTPQPDRGEAEDAAALQGSKFEVVTAATEELCIALAGLSCLSSLDLSVNRFCDAGVKTLAAHLRSLPALRRLSLRFVDCGDGGMCALAAAFREGHAAQLTHLNVTDNAADVDFLISGLRGASRLCELEASSNTCSRETMTNLAEAIQSHRGIHTIALGKMRFSDVDMLALGGQDEDELWPQGQQLTAMPECLAALKLQSPRPRSRLPLPLFCDLTCRRPARIALPIAVLQGLQALDISDCSVNAEALHGVRPCSSVWLELCALHCMLAE